MDTNAWYALLAPMFLVIIGIEAAILRARGERGPQLPDTLSNLACGLGQVLFGMFTAATLLALYDWFGARFAVVTWPEASLVPWVLAFPLTDLCYYCFHRASHRVALFWAIHEVHHQSEEMNVSVAMRQTWFSDFTSLLFFWPLPFLGIPRDAFFLAVACLSTYEALQHSRLIRGIGWWGLVFNTPSTHRIHHARDPEYRDHNYASTLVVWDRLFGTFVRETKAPTYGTVERFESWNPLRAQVAPFVALWRRMRRVPRWSDRLKLLVLPPEWIAPGETLAPEVLKPRWERPLVGGSALAIYATVQFLAAGFGGLAVIAYAERLGLATSGLLASLAVITTASVAGLFEGRAWALPLELARLGVLAILAIALGPAWSAPAAIVSAFVVWWIVRPETRTATAS
jgi:alkylglycerol monooxygenase